jgi:hypothetical protein
MSIATPAGVLTSTGVVYRPVGSNGLAALTVPTTPNYALVANSSGALVFTAPPPYLELSNTPIVTTACFPTAGSAPIQATAAITSGAVAYAAAAYTGYSLTLPTFKAPTQSFCNLALPIQIYAKSLNVSTTGGQTLGNVLLAWYGSQTATIPLASVVVGVPGSFYYAMDVPLNFRIATSLLTTTPTIYLCAFFDSAWATSNMGVVINGTITSSNLTQTVPGQSMVGAITENVASNLYNPV